jgi:thymidylate kinase
MGITEGGAGWRVTSEAVSSRRFVPTLSLPKKMGRTKTNYRQRRGLWVVLLGPDGAGKSSVIDGLARGRTAGFEECETYHLRPALWRRRKEAVANCDPHGQSVRGTIISALKLVYLLAANWLAYLIKVRPQLAQGKLIVFDRYFPDCLVDPKRYRLPVSCAHMAGLIARLVPQPDLYVVLDAPPSVLQERKREVTPAESEAQRRKYATLLQRLQKVIMVDASQPLAGVVDDILDHVIELRLQRCRKEYDIA